MTLKTTGSNAPGKLMKLKAWLTVPDAASCLTLLFGENVTEADVLQLGLEGRLKLSVRFVNFTQAKRYVERTDAEYAEQHKDFLTAKTAKASCLPETRPKKRAPTSLDEECSRVVTLRDSVYDLPLVGGERQDVEREYQKQTGGPEVALTAFEGTFVDSEAGIRFQLQKETQGANTTSDGLPYYLEPHVAPYHPKSQYDPAPSLPADSVLVVRATALRELETRALDSTKPSSDSIGKPLGTKERAKLLTIIAALAEHSKIEVSRHSKAAETIKALTADIDAEIPSRTIEEVLKQIPDALERRAKTSSERRVHLPRTR